MLGRAISGSGGGKIGLAEGKGLARHRGVAASSKDMQGFGGVHGCHCYGHPWRGLLTGVGKGEAGFGLRAAVGGACQLWGRQTRNTSGRVNMIRQQLEAQPILMRRVERLHSADSTGTESDWPHG